MQAYEKGYADDEGCRHEVNKQDLLHHETPVCEQRRVKCHSCNDIRQEMDVVKVNLAAINVKLARIDEKIDGDQKTVEKNGVTKVELVQEQLNKQEESNRRLEADNVEIKKKLSEIMKQLVEVQAEQEQMKKANEMARESKVVIAGGFIEGKGGLNSVEMFSLSNGTWTMLKPMKQGRHAASSVVYNNEMFVIGGMVNYDEDVKSMEKLSMNACQADQYITWENFAAELPGKLMAHGSVVYNGQLIVIGGFDGDRCFYSDRITEISLVPPYTIKLLATMPQKLWLLNVSLLGDKIVILGGRTDYARGTVKTVFLYDIIKNECKELAPLPYPVCQMATVKWDDDNVIIMGGDSDGKTLNKVSMYNVKTQKTLALPNMKYKRQGCVAAVVKDTVIVMGGKGERRNHLKSVEGFRFDRNTWEELPEMHEARYWATVLQLYVNLNNLS